MPFFLLIYTFSLTSLLTSSLFIIVYGKEVVVYERLGSWDAPSHAAKNTMEYLRRENISFIEPDMWPPNSPDLNPVDYAVWGALQQMVYHHRSFTTVDQLKETIVTEWTKLSQCFIDRAIDQWRRRLQCVVQQQGGHIEHFM